MKDSLQTWNASSYLQAIAEELKIGQANNIEAITPGSPLSSGIEDFSLFLTEAATVELTTVGGQTVTIDLPAGYNPIRVASVASVSTGQAYAMY